MRTKKNCQANLPSKFMYDSLVILNVLKHISALNQTLVTFFTCLKNICFHVEV
jgi:hypothetical protein